MNNFIFGFGFLFRFSFSKNRVRGCTLYFPVFLGKFGFLFYVSYLRVHMKKNHCFFVKALSLKDNYKWYFFNLSDAFVFCFQRGYHFLKDKDND